MIIKKEDFVPFKNFVVIEPLEKPQETQSGLALPDESYSATPVAGTVLSVGPEVKNVAVADVVFFRRFSIDELKFTDDTGLSEILSLISEDEIVGKSNKHE